MARRDSIWEDLKRMQEQMDSMFENFFKGDPFLNRGQKLLEAPVEKGKELLSSDYRHPVSDIYETKDHVVAEVEMPGIDKKDINVNVTDDSIEIRAETKAEEKKEDKKKGMYRFERNYTGFYRKFYMPEGVDSEKANAEYNDGVLTIKVPKIESKKQKKKRLEIK